MSLEHPAESCRELSFGALHRVPEASQPALEDYARAVCGASAAALVPGDEPGLVRGVHLCRPRTTDEATARDVEAFARELGSRAGQGLGWS